MFALIRLYIIIFLFEYTLSEDILLPSFLTSNQSFSSSTTSLYLCHVHQLNNSKEFFLQGYNIVNGGNTSYVHHLLLYECSIKDKLIYSGLCGMYSVRLMPRSVYRNCQTRIIIAWAKGGQLKYNYPIGTGLQITSYTQLLLEVHFESMIPSNHSIGVHLRFYPKDIKPQYEIGVLTLGTLAHSPLFLPPRLNQIRFPTYCVNDCLKYYLQNNHTMNIFSILVHAHKRATRIILKENNFNRLIDRNPFEFHRQEIVYYNKPYPQINSSNELSLICYYSTENDYSKGIYGGHDSNDEMCQAFLYYYPKIESFPLCLSIPVYENKNILNNNQNWTPKRSLLINNQLELNLNHLKTLQYEVSREAAT
ncbi:unnamed protein product [Adineta steineri]|uniref:Uncharacterized protein n=1 Tax=Adineta steineri TaxID=433720 RepID=A0A814ZYH0_9BILA|nr:unnamed protein product [Adineta steineri]